MNWKYMGVDVRIFEPSIILSPEVIELGDGCRLDSFLKLEGGQGMKIGRYVHIASFCHVGIGGGKIIISDYAAVASGTKILSGSNQMEGLSMSACAPQWMQVVKRVSTFIGEGAFLGAGVVVMPGINIGARAVVGAGAVVTKDVPIEAIVAGVPAKVIGWRPKPEMSAVKVEGE